MSSSRACSQRTWPMKICRLCGVERFPHRAFEGDRRLGDARRRTACDGAVVRPDDVEFAHVRREALAAAVHLLGHRLVGEVDDEFAGRARCWRRCP